MELRRLVLDIPVVVRCPAGCIHPTGTTERHEVLVLHPDTRGPGVLAPFVPLFHAPRQAMN